MLLHYNHIVILLIYLCLIAFSIKYVEIKIKMIWLILTSKGLIKQMLRKIREREEKGVVWPYVDIIYNTPCFYILYVFIEISFLNLYAPSIIFVFIHHSIISSFFCFFSNEGSYERIHILINHLFYHFWSGVTFQSKFMI